jgi:Mitochondrial carrier protein
MGGGGTATNSAKDYPYQYFGASAIAAFLNYPLWRASAIGQSAFHVPSTYHHRYVSKAMAPYLYAMLPPYKGAVATVFGMTWARAAIFYGSDAGRDYLKTVYHCSDEFSIVFPPLIVSTIVQFINMPVVRATVTIQDPSSNVPNVWSSIKQIYASHGIKGLWHGTSAGILKSVPKYCTAIIVKDIMEAYLSKPNPEMVNPEQYKLQNLSNSAIKSITAGIAGAVLTNPLDVIRNEMFKTNQSIFQTTKQLYETTGYQFLFRGMGKNVVAVALPGNVLSSSIHHAPLLKLLLYYNFLCLFPVHSRALPCWMYSSHLIPSFFLFVPFDL